MRRLVPVLVLLALAGCSDGSSTTSTVADDSARTAYIAEADALCARIAEEHPEVAESAEKLQQIERDDPKLLEKAAKHFALVLRVAQSAQKEFETVAPPVDDAPRIAALNDMNAQAISSLENAVAKLRDGRPGTQALTTYAARIAAADELAKAYGFEVCSRLTTGS